MATLLIAEHDNKALNGVTNKALTAATAIGGPVHVLVAARAAARWPTPPRSSRGVEKVLVADDARLRAHAGRADRGADRWPRQELRRCRRRSSSAAKNVMPRAAALLDVQPISDISAVVSADTFERPIYAGNAIQT